MSQLLELGENIRHYRRLQQLTQRALAEKLHVSTQAISSWEQGITYPDIGNLCRLSEALSVSIDKLLASRAKQDEVYMIGVDGGSTKTEFALFSSAGGVKKTFRLPGTNASVKGVSETLSILRKGIDLCLEAYPTVCHIFIGNAGSFLDEIQESLSQTYMGVQIYVTSDAINALMCAAHADAAMILGTGSILLRPEGEDFRYVGGWGYKLGDPGSAYNFGREVCRLVCAYEDGLDRDPLIYSLVKARAETEDLRTVGRMSSAQIAALAPVVFEADLQGDVRAKRIIQQQMEELAQFVRAICPEGGTIVAVGGIAEHYGDRLLPMLSALTGTDVQFVVPDLPPVYGACRACMKHFQITPSEAFEERFRSDYRALTG